MTQKREKWLAHSPLREELLEEVESRNECKLYPTYSTCCDETFKRISDWCTGCILKAVADEMRSK